MSLSDRIQYGSEFQGPWLWAKDLKASIKRILEEIMALKNSDWCKVGTKDQQEGRKGAFDRAVNEIDKEMGDDLK